MSGWFRRPSILGELPGGQHAVIEASAGTGKTYTLERLVVDLLLAGDPPATIQEILVVTFTERATYELRTRVRRLIAHLASGDWADEERATPDDPDAWHIDDRARARLESALQDFDQAPILTIHGFCQRVLTEHAFLTRRPLEGSLVDGRHTFARAFRNVLRREIATEPTRRELLEFWLDRDRGNSVESLERLLFEGVSRPEEKRPEFEAGRLERCLVAIAELLADGSLMAAFERAAVDASLPANSVNKFTRIFRRLGDAVTALRERGVVAALGACQHKDDHFAYLVSMKSNQKVLTSRYPDDYAELEPLFALLGELDQCVVPLEAAVFQSYAGPALAELNRLKAADGLYDFDDMIGQLLLATASDELVQALRRQYRHALIDEFQDTDGAQWQIFCRIFFELRQGDGGNGCLRVIGDPKQAIYSFRGADLWAYQAARTRIVASHGGPHHLADNFRSTASFLEAVNLLLEGEPEPTFFTGDNEYPVPVRCGRKDLRLVGRGDGQLAPVCVLEQPVGDGKLDRDAMKRAVASAYAAEIASLLGADGAMRLGEGDALEPITPGKIFILTRSIAEGHEIGAHLRAVGVPCSFYKEEGLFQCDEAFYLLDVLTAIAEPTRQAHLFRAWSTPFFDLPLSHLQAHRQELDSSAAMAQILEWKAVADRRDYDHLFASLPVASGLSERLLFRGDERSLTNILHLLELLAEQTIGGSLTLPEVVSWLSGLTQGTRKPGDVNANIQRIESEREAVQIMTMHTSKGLEADLVFVFGGIRAGGGGSGFGDRFRVYHDDAGKRVLHVGELSRELKDRVRKEEAEEDERLLYVTLTRARARVYLPFCAAADGKGKLRVRGSYEAMNRRLHALDRSGQLCLPLFERRTLPTTTGEAVEDGGTPHALANLDSWTPPATLLRAPPGASAREEIRRQRSGLRVTSYSHMKRMLGGVSGVPAASVEAGTLADQAKAEIKPPAGDPEADTTRPRGSSYGIFLHELLEHLDFTRVLAARDLEDWQADPPTREMIERRGRLHGIDPRHLGYSSEILYKTLTSPLWLGDDLIIENLASCEENIRELEFLYPIPESGHPSLAEPTPEGCPLTVQRGYVKGFIDHVFVHRGRTYVLDWKSDLLSSYSPGDLVEQVRTHYYWQETLYSLALCKMLGLRDWRSTEERFGGVIYVFLRGMPGRVDDLQTIQGGTDGVYFQRPSWEKLQDLTAQVRDFHA